MKVYKAIFYYPDGWNDHKREIGLFSTKEKAWDECVKVFNSLKEYRVHKNYDEEKQKFVFWYYESHYKGFSVKEVNIK